MTGPIRTLLQRLRYPRMVILPGPHGPLRFRVHNPIEEYRTAGYGGEQEFLERFTAELVPEDVVFDIGASIGLMTVFAAAAAPLGRVCAFEPDPATARRLARNVRLNRLSNVEIVSWAVGEREGCTTLFTDGPGGNAPTLRRQQGREGAPSGTVEVPVRTLDTALLEGALPHPSVLKIDIEGAEILCLRGGEGLLGGRFGIRPRLIFLEVHPAYLPAFGATAAEVTGLVEALGYQVRWRGERGDQVHYCYTPSPGVTIWDEESGDVSAEQIVGMDRHQRAGLTGRDPSLAGETGLESTGLEELLASSDVVSLNCDLNPTSRGLIDARRLALMKPTAVLINTARGPVVEEAALIEALTSARHWGAGRDNNFLLRLGIGVLATAFFAGRPTPVLPDFLAWLEHYPQHLLNIIPVALLALWYRWKSPPRISSVRG